MKTILLIVGPNGVGKSTTAKAVLDNLPHSALVDSDWCRVMNPYDKDTAANNIYGMIKNYLLCSEIETVIFPYGFHGDRKQRYNTVISKLRNDGITFTVFSVILTCSFDENILRLQKDKRDNVRIERGMKTTYHLYDEYSFPKIDTTNLTVEQTAEKVIALLKEKTDMSTPENQGIPSAVTGDLINGFENHNYQITILTETNEYNHAFWSTLDKLVSESNIIIDRPKGTRHPKYPDCIYPLDYGYLENTSSMDSGGIDVWKGSDGDSIDAVICTVDLMKRDSEIKILIGCSEEEKQVVLSAHNNSEYMKGILIRRFMV